MQRSKAKKMMALVIDNDKMNRHFLRDRLEEMGVPVITAEKGQVGLAKWADKRDEIRIVITKLAMPVVDGFEVLKTIRSQELQKTYLLPMIDTDEKDKLSRALTCGADEYLHIPLTGEELEFRLLGAKRCLALLDQQDLLDGLVELTAERGGETIDHLHRIRGYCQVLADDLQRCCPALGLSAQMVADIARLSVLHDIGKTGLPDGLLNKRGKYSPKEYEIIKDHTTIGGNMLMKILQRSGSALIMLGYEIVMAHHERWDGQGYPFGLEGPAIPLAGRIVAFADVYDALLSRRPYKDPLSLHHAEHYIKEEKGKHFDPAIVESYERNRDRFTEIYDRHKELYQPW